MVGGAGRRFPSYTLLIGLLGSRCDRWWWCRKTFKKYMQTFNLLSDCLSSPLLTRSGSLGGDRGAHVSFLFLSLSSFDGYAFVLLASSGEWGIVILIARYHRIYRQIQMERGKRGHLSNRKRKKVYTSIARRTCLPHPRSDPFQVRCKPRLKQVTIPSPSTFLPADSRLREYFDRKNERASERL